MKVEHIPSFKQKALKWAATAEVCCILDSNGYSDLYGRFDLLIAVGSQKQLNAKSPAKFEELKAFYDDNQSWMFGVFGYDLKNELENLGSANLAPLDFPDLFFFIPNYLIAVKNGTIELLIGDSGIIETIAKYDERSTGSSSAFNIQSRISKETYLNTVKSLQQHIARGDIYEITFCQEFFAAHAAVDPVEIYARLCQVSPTPFSGFFKIKDKYILSASPERYLCKRGNKLISQPIKGTAKRDPDATIDLQIKTALSTDVKEKAENVMIVDLVRNDLTKVAIKGSVKVDELFGIYGFPQVYQMISTITCELDPEVHFIDAIKYTFPMGSMTGAPKVKAMELIEAYEFSKRGAYSGAIGYISPDAEFDFNVIIRSILYDASKAYLSFQVGSAITYAADASAEYEECLLKASAIIQTLSPV